MLQHLRAAAITIIAPLAAACGSEGAVSTERQPDASGPGGASGSAGWSGSGSSGGTSSDAAATDGDSGGSDASACDVKTSGELPFAAGWGDYGSSYAGGGHHRDAKGVVRLEGLISKLEGVPAQGDVIATLPDADHPSARLIFTSYSKGYGRVDVTAAGELVWMSGAVTEKDYVSLAQVAFRPGPPSSQEWFEPSLGTWQNYGGSYAPAAYTRDAADEVHLRGLIKKADGTSSENLFTLPEAHRPAQRLLFLVASGSSTPGRVDVFTDGSVVWYPGNPSYVSLNGISFHVAPVSFEAASLEGTWASYSATHAPAGYYKDCFGRVHLRGLVTEAGGAPAESVIFTLPAGHRPALRVVFPVATRLDSGAAPTTGRVDVHPDGRVMWMSGGSFEKDWTSLTGLSFAAGN